MKRMLTLAAMGAAIALSGPAKAADFSGKRLDWIIPFQEGGGTDVWARFINTPLGRASHFDEQAIRRAALQFNVPCVTTMTGAQAVVEAITSRKETAVFQVYSLQELHEVAQAAG